MMLNRKNISICSYFKDSVNWQGRNIDQVNKYFTNLLGQTGIHKERFKFFLLEGNSKDNTYENLLQYKENNLKYQFELEKFNIDGEVASVVSQNRFSRLSKIGNKLLEKAKEDGRRFIFWMESDLIPPKDLMIRLFKWMMALRRKWHNTLAISPIPIFNWQGKKQFYDTWAFEGNFGEKWQNQDLDHIIHYREILRPMNSIGSCAILNADLLRKFNINFGEGCFPELCRQGKSHGLDIYCDTSLEIKHPSKEYVNGRMI